MELRDISRSSLIGKTINGLYVMKVTDGTLKTTFRGYLFRFKNKKRDFIRDPESDKLIVKLSRKMLFSNEYFPGQGPCAPILWKSLPDEGDKRVWWDANPHFERQSYRGDDGIVYHREIYTGRDRKCEVGTYEEFLDAVNAKEGKEPPAVKEEDVPVSESAGEWTTEDDDFIRANYKTMTYSELADSLGVEVDSLKIHFKEDLKLKKR